MVAQVYNPSTQEALAGAVLPFKASLSSKNGVRSHAHAHAWARANVDDNSQTISLRGRIALLEPSP